MAAYDYPVSDLFLPASCKVWIAPNVLVVTSPLTQQSTVRDLVGDKWRMQLDFDWVARGDAVDDQASREAFWNSVGLANTVRLWHFARPVPRGTMRGSPTLGAAAAKGATSLSISTTAGATLYAGDMIGVASQWLQVTANASADGAGAMAVSVAPKLRAAVASGSAVAWSRPTVEFRCVAPIEIPYSYGPSPGFTVDLVER